MVTRSLGALIAILLLAISVVLPAADAAPGDPDSGFGSGGIVRVNLGGPDTDEAHAIAMDASGGFYVAGSADINQGQDDMGVFRLDSSGALNPAFGSLGSVLTNLGGSEQLRAVALQPDGKIVAAGTSCPSGCDFLLVRHMADGSLDPSFGSGGVVTLDFGGNDQFDAVALQPDGKIVAAGVILSSSSGFYEFAVARFDASGTLDPSFGGSGVVQTAFPGTNARARAMKLTGDGKIVVAGAVAFDSGHDDIGLARYNADGTLDSGFGNAGTVVADLGGIEQGRGLALQPDGKAVVAGYHYSTSDYVAHAAVTRFKVDGTPDASFGSGGTGYGPDRTSAYAAAIQSDGKIVAAGIYDPSGSQQNHLAATRFNADGTLNSGYGSGGVAEFPVSGSDQAFAVVVQPDGKVVIAGRALQDMAVVRFLAADALVSDSFPAGGGTIETASQPSSDEPVAVAITSADAGDVSITETPAEGSAPSGYSLVGSEFDITAPAATLGGTPLTLTFRLDPSLFPPGDQAALSSLAMLRNGLPLRDCSSGPLDGANAEDACTTSALDGSVGVITVQSWHASAWQAARLERSPYPFSGFFAPVDNRDSNGNLVLNKVKAGSAIPVKFGLGGDRGLSIFAVGSPASVKIPCDPTAPIDPLEQTVPTTSSSLTYDALSQRYTYVWKTAKTFEGCRQLRVTLIDGTTHVADFKFAK